MKLLDHRMKAEMEECKRRAREVGLIFPEDTLEYLVSNQDMLELMPKNMIPTLYDYWTHDIETIRGKWAYDAFPHNPYEVVINTRPPVSFFNTDNADWFNMMLFYHVLGHIDFDQSNIFFRRTWDDDFYGQALADKRLINSIRDELGAEKRWVDYVLEFTLAIDNLVGFHQELKAAGQQDTPEIFSRISSMTNFYFGQFLKRLQETGVIASDFYYDELERYNQSTGQFGKEQGEAVFFQNNAFRSKFPEFNEVFKKWETHEQKAKPKDILEHLMEYSEFLNKENNKWMKDVMQVVRRTSLYFAPQIRTKICNEGWASLWHERLFTSDARISTHEVNYARMDSAVTLDPRLGLNPYAVGKHLYEFIEDMARKGRLSPSYQFMRGIEARKHYDKNLGEDYGRQALFEARQFLDDNLLINFLSDEDFQDFANKYQLFSVGVRPSHAWGAADIYIKSKNSKALRRILNKALYHPPNIVINAEKAKDGELYLEHIYEGRTLLAEYIPTVLMGLQFLWGKRVRLETTEYTLSEDLPWWYRYYPYWFFTNVQQPKYKRTRVVYTCEGRRMPVTKTTLQAHNAQIPLGYPMF